MSHKLNFLNTDKGLLRFLLILFFFAAQGMAWGQADLQISGTSYHDRNGSIGTFTLYVSNNGPDTATNVVVTSNLNDHWNFTLAGNHTESQGTLTAIGRNLTWTVGSIRNGETAVLVFNAAANYSDNPTYRNYDFAPYPHPASVTSSNDNNAANNSVSIAGVSGYSGTGDLRISKTTSNANPIVGSTVTFTIILSRDSPGSGNTIQIMDILPRGFTFQSYTAKNVNNGNVGTYNDSTGVWSVGQTSNGGSYPYTLTITATAATLGDYTNVTFISQGGPDSDVSDNFASVSGTILAPPEYDLSISKDVDILNPAVGSNVTFTIEIENQGDTAESVIVTDLLPSGYEYVSSTPSGSTTYDPITGLWTIGSLTNNSTATLDITAKVLGSGNLTNTATITSGLTYDSNGANNSAQASVTPAYDGTANLEITKSGWYQDNATGITTFVITVRNNGPDAAKDVIVKDNLVSSLDFNNPATSHRASNGLLSWAGPNNRNLTWNIPTIPNGGVAVLLINATNNTNAAKNNTATVSSTAEDTIPGNNSSTITTQPDYNNITNFSISKSVDISDPYIGDEVEFTIQVQKISTQAGEDGVLVIDKLPSGLQYISHTASNGNGNYTPSTGVWSLGGIWNDDANVRTLTIRALVLAPDEDDPDRYKNVATITKSGVDTNIMNNMAEVTIDTPVADPTAADLSITKNVNESNPPVDSNVIFTIEVENLGSNDATGVVVTDVIPSGYEFVSSAGSTYNAGTKTVTRNIGNLAVSGTASFTITAKVLGTGTYTNTASVIHDGNDPAPGNNSDTASVTPYFPSADLQITKSVNNAAPTVFNNVVFTLTVKNNGPDNAVDVTVDDPLPVGFAHISNTSGGAYNPNTGKWNIGTLANGASKTLTITAKVLDTETRAEEDYTNTATVSGTVTDLTPENNESSVVVEPFFPEADLAITIEIDNQTPLVGGGDVTFTIHATNNGPDNALGVSVAALLPSGYQYVSNIRSTGSYNSFTGVWAIGDLANGDTAEIQIKAQVLGTGDYNFITEITGAVEEDQTGNNTDNATIDNIVDLEILKEVTSPLTQPGIGDEVVFTVTVNNVGDNPATGVIVKDVIPSGYDYFDASGGATYDIATRTVTWNAGDLVASGTAQFTITTTIRAGGNHTNTATVSAQQGDDEPGNNSAGATTTPDISNAVDLKITQKVDNETPDITNADGTVTFIITAKNAVVVDEEGNGIPLHTVSHVKVNTQLAEGLQYDTSNTLTGNYDSVSGIWDIGPLNDSISVTLNITVKIPGDESILPGAAYLSIAQITADEEANDYNIINNRAYSIVSPIGQKFLECDVNAENPVFTENFGSGTAIFGGELPDGRTNLQYFEPPAPPGTWSEDESNYVADGRYVIGHNANDAFNVWKNIPDHTGLPNGYYMIMNASLEPHEFFRMRIDLADEFCSNTQYTVSVWVANVNSEDDFTYCTTQDASGELKLPEIGYFIQNNTGAVLGAGTSGEIAYSPNPQWVEYTFIFTTSEDDEYVDLVLFNQALGGCGNDLAIDDISVYACMTPPVRLDMQIESDQLEVCGGEDVIMNVIENPDPEIENDDYAWPPTAWAQDPDDPRYVVYQWQKSDNSADPDSWVDIPGATSDTYVIEDFQEEDQAYYRLLYAQGGNLDKESCRFPSDDLFPMFNATPVLNPIEPIGGVNYVCPIPGGTLQLTNDYDFSDPGYGTWDDVEMGGHYANWTITDGTGSATISTLDDNNAEITAVSPGTVTIKYEVWSPKGVCSNFVEKVITVLDDCPTCVEEPTDILTSGDPSKIGISILESQLAGWPENIPNGFIVLESKEKGFVITRVANDAAIAQPKEGMLVYNIADKCIKLYNGSEWHCIDQECDEVP